MSFDRAAYEQQLAERDLVILERYAAGASYETLAQQFSLARSSIKRLILYAKANPDQGPPYLLWANQFPSNGKERAAL